MKVFELQTSQDIPISLEKAWEFFSSPKNLKKITPSDLGFQITSKTLIDKMYPGQIISYTVRPVLGIPMKWTTEITHVEPMKYFVDEQRFGPYAMWHHQHFFKAIDGGVNMKDIIHYAIPLGILGRIANGLFVENQLKTIFDYRHRAVAEMFGSI